MYTLVRYRDTKIGRIKEYLGYHFNWYQATNNAVKFESPSLASDCYNATEFDTCSQIVIEGPKGGTYRPHNGKYWA